MKLCLVLLFIEKHNKQKKEKKWAHTYETILWPGGGGGFGCSVCLPSGALRLSLRLLSLPTFQDQRR